MPFIRLIKYGGQKLYFLVPLLCTISAPALAELSVMDGVPEDFEHLNTPRPTSITVFYGGDIIGTFRAHFAPGTITFDQPAEIIKTLPTISDKPIVQEALSKSLTANAELLCGPKRVENCGTLTPDVAGIIFDENSLNAELFINKKYLSVSNDNNIRYLPLPENKNLSSVYAFDGAVNAANQSDTNFSLGNDSTFSMGATKLETSSTIANDGIRFDTVSGVVEKEGWREAAGLFRSRSMQILPDRDMAGASISTSNRTLLDDHKVEGNDIIVFLPRHAFVSIYREGRLYSSRTYEAGNQHIDTSELPDGAYEITLKIQEVDGDTREEKRFFAKSQDIPPEGEPTYYMQGGVIRRPATADSTIPEFTDDPIVRVGTVRRLRDNIGVSFSGLGISDRAVMETGIFWLNSGSRMQATALSSTAGDMGMQGSFIQTLNKLNISVDARKLWAAKKQMPGFEDSSNTNTQATTSIAYAITPDLAVGARASYVNQENAPESKTYGPYSDWRIWQRGESSLSLSSSYTKSDNSNEALVMLNFAHRIGAYGITTSAGADIGGPNAGPTGSARIWHDNNTPGNELLLGGGVSNDSSHQTVSADADYRNNFGQLHGSVQDAYGQGKNTIGFGGNFAFNAAQYGTEVHLGGDQSDKSAVIIDSEGDVDDKMKVFVNNSPRSTFKVGEKLVVYLAPFHTYNIRISPEKNTLVDYDSNPHRVTLYPGNVVKMSWKINKFYVVTAHIINPDGTPLTNALLQESHEITATDGNGYIQAEISKPKLLTFTDDNNSECIVNLPDKQRLINGVILFDEALTCMPVSNSATTLIATSQIKTLGTNH